MQDEKVFGERIENLEDVTLGTVSLSIPKIKYISEKMDKWYVSKFNLIFFSKDIVKRLRRLSRDLEDWRTYMQTTYLTRTYR